MTFAAATSSPRWASDSEMKRSPGAAAATLSGALAFTWAIVWIIAPRCVAQPGMQPPPRPADSARVEKSAQIVRAGIELWRFVGSYFDENTHAHSPGPAVFAPDGRSFVVAAARGHLEEGVNESRLLLFTTREPGASRASAASEGGFETLVSLRTSGNEPAIFDVRWPMPSKLFFRGAVGTERAQVYAFELSTRRSTRVTDEPAGIEWYDVSADGATVLYMARTLADTSARQQQRLTGVIAKAGEAGWDFDTDDPYSPVRRIVLARPNEATAREVWRSTGSSSYFDVPRYAVLAPTGRFAILGDTLLPRDEKTTEQRHISGGRVFLLDLARASFDDVAEAPPQRASRLALWSADEAFVVFNANVERQPALVELDIASRAIRVVTPGAWRPIRWTTPRSLLAVNESAAASSGLERPRPREHTLPVATFERTQGAWKRIPLQAVRSFSGSAKSALSVNEHLVVDVAETPTQAPEIAVRLLQRNSYRRLTHLNADTATLPLAPAEEITWQSARGERWRARIVTEATTQKRPTVVLVMDQGWNDGFILDDAFMRAAFPVQALAARGFTVFMVYFPPELGAHLVQEAEWDIVESGFAGLLAKLATHPAVDSAHLGITGFSHAGWITHVVTRKFPAAFSAAIAIDNTSFSYFDYLINNEERLWRTYDRLYAGPLFGTGMTKWLEKAVGFHPEQVFAPVLLETHGGDSADAAGTRLAAWEMFSGLNRAGKPVEMVRYTNGVHTLVRPREQFSSATRQIDWFAWWLMNEVDAHPAKAAQYARWTILRSKWQPAQDSAAR